ncbi:restriction endonuclease subunit S [Mesoflavibacter profundi]|uniref:restriction endonuclease subunit S n=1 Tax=Mesoflavibacter profundi TaxID=2708110 RepID=UPI00168B4893|nr:restriction endonuclease subunit S [Mesoflavibacter profundi]
MSKVKYQSYKPSKTIWLDQIPEHWQETDLRMLFSDNKVKNLGLVEKNLLSLSYGKLKRKDIDNATGLVPASFEGYQIIDEGYIVLRFTDLQNDKKSLRVGYANERGIITSAYIGLAPKTDLDSKYYYYLLHYLDKFKYYYNLGGGVRQSLSYKDFGRETILVPSDEEQTTIANFLDYKTEKINRFITKKKQLIELLNEQKAAIINQAVTKGINPNVPMKDSGIEWLGEIPEHWKTTKLIGVSNFVRGNSSFKKDELLSNGNYVALQYGKTYKIDEVDKNFQFYVNDEFYKDSQVVNKGDVIIVSTSETIEDLGHSAFYNRTDIGLLGGEQMLLKPNKKIDGKYLYYSSKVFTKELRKYSTGVKVFRFNINDLKTIYTSIPPIEEQIKISEYIQSELNTVTKTITTIEKEITLVEEYKTALIAEAVTGKIDVRDFKLPTEETPLAMVAEEASNYKKEVN